REAKTMARIPIHTLETAPEGSREGLKVLHDRFGKILNIQGAMAHVPVTLKTYLALKDILHNEGAFDASTEQAIALVVAEVNGCDYCRAAHTLGAMAAGLTEDQTIAIRQGDVDFDSKLGALLTFAREATQERGRVRRETWQAALDAGWIETDLLEAHVHVVANVFTNYFNRLVETDLDLPPALPLT
ncbi:MAG: carboxymuconolactone decarboxylase family protein, partial [Actinomycetota bacterium]